MADVFISYHVKSAGETVRQIAAELKKRNISCWYSESDEKGVKGGEDFAEEIPAQIKSCQVFLLILDQGVMDYPKHVLREIHIVDKADGAQNSRILPFKRENFTPTDAFEYYLALPQRIDGTQEDGMNKLVRRIAEIIYPDSEELRREVESWNLENAVEFLDERATAEAQAACTDTDTAITA